MKPTTDDFLRLQIEQAAKGCVSGTLREWPVLASALEDYGCPLHPDSSALTVKLTCMSIVLGWREAEIDTLRRRVEIAKSALEKMSKQPGLDCWEDACDALDQMKGGA